MHTWRKIQDFWSKYGRYILPIALFALAFIPRVMALSYFITVDEPAWINRSARFMLALLSNNIADTMHPQILDGGGPGIVTVWVGALGLLLHYLMGGEVAANSLIPFLEHYMQPINEPNILPMARIITVSLASVTIPALYLGLKDWLGSRTALLGALLLAFDPFFMAHSRVLHHDVLVAIFMTLSLMWMLTSLWHRYTHLKVALSGVMFTLALLSKLMGGFLLPFYILLFVLAYFWSPVFRKSGRGGALRRLLLAASICAMSAIVTFVIVSPGMWTDPLTLFNALFLRGLGMAEKGHAQFFWGIIGNDPGPLFYPVVLIFRTTPVTFLGFLLAFVALRDQSTNRRNFVRLTLLFAFLFALFLTLTPKKQARYLLPIFPWVDLLAAIGWLALLRYLGRLKRRLPDATRLALPMGLVLLQFVFLLSDFPYYFSYYNPLFGGTPAAGKVLLVGWGEGLDEVGRYLDQEPDAEELVVSAVPAIAVRPYFSGHVLDFYNDYSHLWADYVVIYVSQFQRNFPSEELLRRFGDLEVEHVVTRHGLPYAYIYKGARFAHYETPIPRQPTDLDFGGLFRLTGFDDISATETPNVRQVRLYWESLEGTETDFTWSLRLLDRAGHQWAQTDVRPMGGALPTGLWRPGAIVISDNQVLDLPRGIPPGEYELHLQVYSLEDMNILPVTDEAGRSTRTTASVGTVQVPKQTPLDPGEELAVHHAVNRDMAPSVRLIGYDPIQPEASPGQTLPVTLYWQALDDAHMSYQVRLALLDEAGRVVLDIKNGPHSGQYPTDLWTAGEIVQDRHDLPIPGYLDGGSYHLQLTLWDAGAEVDVSPKVDLGRVEVSGRPHHYEIPEDIQYPQGGDFDYKVRLLGFDLDETAPLPGETVQLTLYWQALDAMRDSYQVFIHILDDSDLTIWGQHDSIPGQGTLATDTWFKGEVISDVHPIVLDPKTPDGDYVIEIGFYEPDSGQRLSVSSRESADRQNYILLELPINVQR